jgi:kumamolisin
MRGTSSVNASLTTHGSPAGRPSRGNLVIALPTQPPYIRRPLAAAISYDARKVAEAYGCPVGQHDGAGVTIGIVELGGGYNAADLKAYAQRLGIPEANVTVVGVDGATSTSDGPNGADGEVMLDIEVIAAVAPGATQRVYFGPNTDAGFLDAITQATAECTYVSISWGGPESSWDPAILDSYEAVFGAARARGVTVFAAAGDSGSTDGTGKDVVDFPASSPSVVGCGGTRLTLGADGTRSAEVVWNDNPTSSATGGGMSAHFPGRQVPDIAGNADPQTGYQVLVDGQSFVIGGTSAVAPLYAAMTAIVRQVYGQPWDFLNTVLTNPSICFDVTEGNNGGYKAGPGRDNVSGYGVVDVSKLVTLLQSGTQIPAPGGNPVPADTTVTFTDNQISELADWAKAPHQSHKATLAAAAWKAANH